MVLAGPGRRTCPTSQPGGRRASRGPGTRGGGRGRRTAGQQGRRRGRGGGGGPLGPASPQEENNKLSQHGRRLARRRGARRDDGGREAPGAGRSAGPSSDPAAAPSRLRLTEAACGRQTRRQRLRSAPETQTFTAGVGAVAGRSSAPGSVVRRFAAVGTELYGRRMSRWKWEGAGPAYRDGARGSLLFAREGGGWGQGSCSRGVPAGEGSGRSRGASVAGALQGRWTQALRPRLGTSLRLCEDPGGET
nr:protein FAM117B-like [Equus asinus]